MQKDRLSSLEKSIATIELRNKRVELDKAWEVSWTRRILLSLLTYLVIVILMWSFESPQPFLNAIIPAAALLLSGPTLGYFKNLWLKKKRQ